MSDYPRCPRSGCGGLLLMERGHHGHDDRVFCVCGFSAWRDRGAVMPLPAKAVVPAHVREMQRKAAEKRDLERAARIEKERQSLLRKLARLDKRASA